MSLIISAVNANGVSMLTDGASIDETSILRKVSTKVSVSHKARLAVSCRGRDWLCDLIRNMVVTVAETSTFDGTLIEVEGVLLQNRALIESEGVEFELVIAGISEGIGPCHFHMASSAYNTFSAWKMERVTQDDCIFGGDAAGADIPMGDLVDAGGDVLRQFGVRIVDAVRANSGNETNAARPGHCVIGGLLDLATVTLDGVTVERLHSWPEDVVGEKIVPRRVAA